MPPYVPATRQLVVEVFVRDVRRATAFYRAFGFEVVEDKGSFVALTWEGHELFLDERPHLPAVPDFPAANVRVMVPDVDRYWALALAKETGCRIVAPIADRDYGLRDFTVADPDGFGVR